MAIILSNDGKIVGRSTGQGTNHWVCMSITVILDNHVALNIT